MLLLVTLHTYYIKPNLFVIFIVYIWCYSGIMHRDIRGVIIHAQEPVLSFANDIF